MTKLEKDRYLWLHSKANSIFWGDCKKLTKDEGKEYIKLINKLSREWSKKGKSK